MSVLLILLMVSYMADYHALYLSTCELIVHEDLSWEGKLRIFFDDLEDAISNETGKRPNLNENQIQYHTKEIENYLNEHLLFKHLDGQILFILEHAVRNQDVVEIRIKGKQSWPTGSIIIQNDLLMEIFESQKNVMIIKNAAQIRTLYFKKNHVQDKISLTG